MHMVYVLYAECKYSLAFCFFSTFLHRRRKKKNISGADHEANTTQSLPGKFPKPLLIPSIFFPFFQILISAVLEANLKIIWAIRPR